MYNLIIGLTYSSNQPSSSFSPEDLEDPDSELQSPELQLIRDELDAAAHREQVSVIVFNGKI